MKRGFALFLALILLAACAAAEEEEELSIEEIIEDVVLDDMRCASGI